MTSVTVLTVNTHAFVKTEAPGAEALAKAYAHGRRRRRRESRPLSHVSKVYETSYGRKLISRLPDVQCSNKQHVASLEKVASRNFCIKVDTDECSRCLHPSAYFGALA